MTAKGLAGCLLLSLALLGACSDDDDDSAGPTSGAAGEMAGGNGPESTAGEAPDHAGNGSVGGNASTPEGGAPQGGANAHAAGMPAMTGGGGATGEPGVERLEICARFAQKFLLANQFALLLDKSIFHDPCVGWTTTLYEDEPTPSRDEHTNALTAWSYGLWGCTDSGVSGFAVLFEQPEKLTAGDAKRLIDYYLLVLDVQLNTMKQATLSPNEVQQLRAALERLSQTMITDPSLEYSHPECLDPPGGQGGAGGAAGGAGGEGGLSLPSGGQGGEPALPSLGGGS